MTLGEMIQILRMEADDAIEPYFWSDDTLTLWLNEAVSEAAIRARLIHESEDQNVCTITLTPGQAVYDLHPALYEIDHISFVRSGETRRQPIRLVSTETLDDTVHDWRDLSGDPEYAIQSDTTIRLVPRPNRDGQVVMEGYRMPMTTMSDPGDTPEINSIHHRYLIQWAIYRAFSVPDSERIDPNRAAVALAEFSGYFGERPDADLRRSTREDTPHTVKPDWV